MAQTLKDLATRDEVVDFLRRAQGGDGGEATLLPFVAYLGGQPAATALVVVRGRSAQVFGGVHVVADHRRKGIGAALLHALLRYVFTSGAARVWVARDVADPPTADDAAAVALYDRAGGVRRRPVVDVVYSPQCPWSPHWVKALEKEIEGLDVEFRAYDLWQEPDRAWTLLRSSGMCGKGSQAGTGEPEVLDQNVFARVFVDGEAAGGIPPAPGTLRGLVGRATGQGATLGKLGLLREPSPKAGGGLDAAPPAESPRPYPRVMPETADYARALAGLVIEPLTLPGSDALMDICLARHPSGFKPDPLSAAAGASLKRRWLSSLDLPGGFFGVAARRGGGYAGIMEVYPRLIAARAGYATGTWGDAAKVLTITCIEVAFGEARHPVMEFLLEGLMSELNADAANCHAGQIEAIGHYGNMAGFNPYWLFDKYGFVRREERVPGVSVVLSKSLVDAAC